MKINPQDLEAIAGGTLEHCDRNAEGSWQGTRDHDVSQNIETLLQHIEGEPPFTILDLGCGPGRDLKAFAELGHVAVGLKGAARIAGGRLARNWTEEYFSVPAGGCRPSPTGPVRSLVPMGRTES